MNKAFVSLIIIKTEAMTNLQSIHREIAKEIKRIEMLKNAKSSGSPDWYDFVASEIRSAKAKIDLLQKQFDQEYNLQNNFS